jgi:hypothetical protein
VHAGGTLDSTLGNLRADIVHNLEGHGGTQYDLSVQSGLALGGGASAWGSRDPDQSAIVVSVGGDAPDALFNVLVDDVPRAQVRIGRRLSLFLPGYRTYKIRLVPAAAYSVDYDSAERTVTVYPGNVQSLAWRAESYFTLFGQAMSRDGAPIANALVQTPKGIAQTDSSGYFQVDARRDDLITIAEGEGASCHIRLPEIRVTSDFASIGKQVCQ